MSKKEKFVVGGIEFTVKRKEGHGCSKCAFDKGVLCGDAPSCAGDGKDYHFKIVRVDRAQPE